MDIGRDNGGVVDLAYEDKAPYAFTGTVKKVVFDLKPHAHEDEQALHAARTRSRPSAPGWPAERAEPDGGRGGNELEEAGEGRSRPLPRRSCGLAGGGKGARTWRCDGGDLGRANAGRPRQDARRAEASRSAARRS